LLRFCLSQLWGLFLVKKLNIVLVTSKRQQAVLDALDRRWRHGATWKELGEELDLHHGAISGVLSTLHKQGYICRLTERRSRSQIYILPKYVNQRETEDFKPNVSARLLNEILRELDADLSRGSVSLARERIAITLHYLSTGEPKVNNE
jgi:DNA-binding MarR family transcriptional regulator